VDGTGRPVNHCFYPHPAAMTADQGSMDEPADYKELVNTAEYSQQEGEEAAASKSPGPMALIDFKIWESGRVDMKKLNQLLRSAISHALWDAVLEYKILPSPLCRMGDDEEESSDDEEESNDDKEKSYDDGDGGNDKSFLLNEQMEHQQQKVETPHEADKLSLKQLSQEAVLAYGSVLGSVSEHLLPKIVIEGRTIEARTTEEAAEAALSLPRSKPLDDFESGRRGRLTTAYETTVWDWFRQGLELGAPSYHEHSVQLFAKPNLADLLEELLALAQAVLPDFDLRTFEKVEGRSFYSPRLEMETNRCNSREGGSSKPEFIVVGRSLRMWKACVGSDGGAELGHLRSKFCKQFQTFPPLLIPPSARMSTGEGPAGVAGAGMAFLSYLKFFLLLLVTFRRHF
jgi:hypothetical protein